MVQLTERAAIELQSIKDANDLEPTEGIKLFPDGNTVDVTVGRVGKGDEVIRHNHGPLLIVDARLVESLREMTLDCTEVESDGRFEWHFSLQAA